MALDPEILALFTDSITITPMSSNNLYGREEYLAADARTVACFIEPVTRLVTNLEGREAVSSATIYINDTGVQATDNLAYTDGTRAYILSIGRPRDENGPSHCEVAVN